MFQVASHLGMTVHELGETMPPEELYEWPEYFKLVEKLRPKDGN